MFKIYLKSYLYNIIILIFLTLILSITNYFFILPTEIIKIIIPVLAIFISAIILGKNVNKKAYLEGIKYSIPLILLILLFRLIFKINFSFKLFILLPLFILSSVIGSMIGINIKKN